MFTGIYMEHSHYNLIYALKNGELVNISNVESGLECKCVCPACGEKLVAKKGLKMMHHFAHYFGRECKYGYETSLHLAAKEILSQASKMMIPAVYVNFDTPKEAELLSKQREIYIDKVELEKRFGEIVPDVVVFSGGKKIFVEIYVTHKVDDIKLAKIVEADVSTIEIDLSSIDVISSNSLQDILLQGIQYKKWVYNSRAELYHRRFLEVAEKLKISKSNKTNRTTLYVNDCPIGFREWKGKTYARYYDDCIHCRYHVGQDEDAILCTGKARISSIKDFKQSFECRKKEHDDINDTLKEHKFVAKYGCTQKRNITEIQIFETDAHKINDIFHVDERESITSKLNRATYIGNWFSLSAFEPLIEEAYRDEMRISKEKKKQQNEKISNLGYEEIKEKFSQNDVPIYDSNGQRWIKCEICGIIEQERYFASYGGKDPTTGICSKCSHNQR